MTYYKSKRNHTPISDAAVFFSKKENYDRVFGQEKEKSKKEGTNSLERVKKLMAK